jgi:chromosome segregation ATPase
MAKAPLFAFSMEQTALHKFFSSADAKFAGYDAALARQSAAIQALAGQLSQMRGSLDRPDRQPEFDARLSAVHSAVDRVQGAVDGRSQLWQAVSDRLRCLEQRFAADFSGLRAGLEARLADAAREAQERTAALARQFAQIPPLIDANRSGCEAAHRGLAEKVRDSKEQIKELIASGDRFQSKIESLASEMILLKADLLHKNDEQLTAFRVELCALKNDRTTFPVRLPEADLSSLELRPEPLIDPDSPPQVPPIHKFSEMAQAIAYLYELVPTLQSILTASHHRVTQKISDFQSRDSRIRALQSELAELTATISTLATREEVAAVMRRRPSARESRGIGLVKCIACGRELSDDDCSQRPRGNVARMAFSIVEEPRPACTSQRTVRRRIQRP